MSNAEYYLKNREKILARAKDHYQRNKDAKKEYDKAYRAKNRERINARFNEWRKANYEDQKAKEDARQAANPEHYAQSKRAYRQRTRERWLEYDKQRNQLPHRRAQIKAAAEEWRKNNPEARRNMVRKRRARIKSVGGVLSKDIESRLMSLQRGKCVYCKTSILEKFHLDHIVPIAAGGANVDENVQLLCPPCNQSKADKMPETFAQSRGLLL